MGSMLSAVKPGPDQTPKTNDEDPAERNAPGGGPRQPRPKPINTGKRGRAGQSTETGSARKTGSLRPAVEKVKANAGPDLSDPAKAVMTMTPSLVARVPASLINRTQTVLERDGEWRASNRSCAADDTLLGVGTGADAAGEES